MKLFMIDKDKKSGTKLNLSRGTEKSKEISDKEHFIYYTTRNKENVIIFPNIDLFSKFNDINNDNKKKLRNTHKNFREKELKHSKYDEIFKKNYNSVDKIENQYTITEFDTPKVEEKYVSLDKNKLSKSFRNKNNAYNTIYPINQKYFNDDIKNNKLSLSFMKTTKINFINNNISNINNIFNKKDYLKNTYTNMNNIIKRKDIITINNFKNSETDISSKENNYENNSILNLLYRKSMKEINQKRINKTNKFQRKDEYEEFLKEILRQYKTKNVVKVKKKIDINYLLKNCNNPKLNESNFKKKLLNEVKNGNANTIANKSDYNELRNGYLETKFNKKSIKNNDKNIRKKNYFNIYRFKKNKRLINEVEEKLSNLEDKIRENFNKFKNNINSEMVNFS